MNSDRLTNLRVNGERLLGDLADVSRIGGTDDDGVDRSALSDADLEARCWFKSRAAGAGFEVGEDGVGNITVRLPAPDPTALTVVCGSHLDSVPHGGRFDGTLGVVAALEVLRTVGEAGLALPVHLEAVNFTDEEGRWIPVFGSLGYVGALTEEDLDIFRGGDRQAFEERLAAAGHDVGLFTVDSVDARPGSRAM